MLVAQLGSSSSRAWLLLVVYVLVAAVFGWLAISLRDVLAGVFCAAAVFGAVRVGRVVWRRSRWKAEGAEIVAAPPNAFTGSSSAVVAAQGQLFVSFGTHIVGAWIQRGVVVIGPSRAAFIPSGGRSHLLVELLLAVFVARFRFVDIALHTAQGGDLDAGIDGAILRHRGFVIDTTWSYATSQRWLSRAGEPGVVWIERAPPSHLSARWAEPARRGPAQLRARRNKVVVIMVTVIAAFVLAGVIAWRAADEVDYLVAGLGYALLFTITLIASLIGIELQIRAASNPSGPPLPWPFG